MPKAEVLSKGAAALVLPVSLLLGIFFFLPWVSIRCDYQSQPAPATQSATTQPAETEPPDKTVTIGKASGWMMMVGAVPAEVKFPTLDDKAPQGPSSRPWLALGLILPAGLLVLGLLTLARSGPPRRLGAVMLLLASGGVGVMLLAANIDYPAEALQALRQTQPEDPSALAELEDAIRTHSRTRPTGIFWTALALYVLAGLCGVVTLVNSPARAPAKPPDEA